MPSDTGNEAAFPGVVEVEREGAPNLLYHVPGLTKREWLAGLAMQGMIASNHNVEYSDAAKDAVEYADALLVALGRG